MTTFFEHRGLINLSRLVNNLDEKAELQEQRTSPGDLTLLCVNASLRELEGFYGMEPLDFLNKIKNKVKFDELDHLSFHKPYIRLLVTGHISNFLAVHSWERKIPHQNDITPVDELRREEYKLLLRILVDKALLLRNEYSEWRLHLPELYTEEECLQMVPEPSSQSNPEKEEDAIEKD